MSTQKYKSFDVFDTLIGRLCYKGVIIFDIMERLTGIHGFAALRRECESCPFEETYEKLSKRIFCNKEELMNLELQLEHEFSFPIWKYMNAVGAQDIMISDMYLSESQIRKLIHKHKQLSNTLIVSSGGKSSSAVWRDKSITRNISLHIGDNRASDYDNPRAYNVPAEHIANVDMTVVEKNMASVSQEFAYILRAVRLTTQHDTEFFTSMAYEAMLPFSIMICLHIQSLVKSQSIQHVIFLSRDGYWLHKMYTVLFPTFSSKYVYFSRLIAGSSHSQTRFVDTINILKGKKLIVDLNGTGATLNKFIHRMPDALLLLCFTWDIATWQRTFKPNTSTMKIQYTGNSWMCKYIEDVFSAPHGSMNANYSPMEPEYNIELLKPYMKAFDIFSNYYSLYSKYVDILKSVCEQNIGAWFNTASTQYPTNINQISNYIDHVNTHDKDYTKYPLVYYSQIGQDKYYIEEIIQFKCNGVFLDIGAYDGITGSNTYFLEKNLNWKGLLVECNPELVDICRKNRTSVVCDKALYKESNTKIDFVIPRGQDIHGGKAQLGGIKDYLRPESLNYFRESYKENTIVQLDTIHINELLEQNDMYTIDYMSLDVEGYELEILKQIDFKKYKIAYLTVEHANIPHYQHEINTYLLSKGYTLARHNRHDDEYVWNA